MPLRTIIFALVALWMLGLLSWLLVYVYAWLKTQPLYQLIVPFIATPLIIAQDVLYRFGVWLTSVILAAATFAFVYLTLPLLGAELPIRVLDLDLRSAFLAIQAVMLDSLTWVAATAVVSTTLALSALRKLDSDERRRRHEQLAGMQRRPMSES